MRILAIGDPHGDLKKIRRIPKKMIDIILLTGDLGKIDLLRKLTFENIERRKKGLKEKKITKKIDKQISKEVYSSSMDVVRYLSKFAPVYTIYGNVEPIKVQRKKTSGPDLTKSLKRMKEVEIINDKRIIKKKILIAGLKYFTDTNWVRDFKPSEFKKKMKEAKKETNKAKKVLKNFGYVDILVCHQPPYGFLDKVTFKGVPKQWKGKHAGSKTILNYVRKKQPQYVFCGHIHEGEGRAKIGKTEVYNLGVAGHKIIEIDKGKIKKIKFIK